MKWFHFWHRPDTDNIYYLNGELHAKCIKCGVDMVQR